MEVFPSCGSYHRQTKPCVEVRRRREQRWNKKESQEQARERENSQREGCDATIIEIKSGSETHENHTNKSKQIVSKSNNSLTHTKTGASLNTDIGPDSEAQIAPHSHEDLHDEKLQQQNPAVHYGEGEEKQAGQVPAGQTTTTTTTEKEGKEKNGGTEHKNGKKPENGKADKTNTPV